MLQQTRPGGLALNGFLTLTAWHPHQPGRSLRSKRTSFPWVTSVPIDWRIRICEPCDHPWPLPV